MLAIEAVIKKAATPLRKTKRVNTRMGVRRKRECVEDSTDCSGITATAAEVPAAPFTILPLNIKCVCVCVLCVCVCVCVQVVRATVVCGGCGENISQSGGVYV